MTLREGNLDAPTRHPIDWQGADYRDEAKASAEMERVFDICHGCRRCVSLCQSFPNLFDLIDATADGEVHGVAKQAREEGFTEIADWFETLGKAERSHANRFQKALDALVD